MILVKSLLYVFSFSVIFLQIELPYETNDKVIDHILKVSPYNAMAYGLLVAASWFMTWVFYKNWKQAEEYNKERDREVLKFNKQSLELMIRIETKLTDQSSFSSHLSEIVKRADRLLDNMSDLMNKIERKEY